MPKHVTWKKINPKQRKFVKEVVKHGNLTEAVMESYNTTKRTTAAAMGSQLIKKEHIKEALLEALQAQNVSPAWIVEKKKEIVNKGMEDLEHSKVSPEILNKTLDGLQRLYERLGDGAIPSSSTHQHLHLHNKTRSEVLRAVKEYNTWFDNIVEGEEA